MSNVFSSIFSKLSRQAIVGGINMELLVGYKIEFVSNPVGDARQDDVAPRPEAPGVPCCAVHTSPPEDSS